MAPVLNVKGQTVKMSFLDLFAPSRPSRRSTGTPRLERKKPKTKASSPSTETSPQSIAATEASNEPTIIIESGLSGSAEWTRLEELALLGMKAEDMTWKEIDEMLPGKDVENIKQRYRELYVAAPASVKPKEGDGKNEEAKKEEERKDGNEEVKTDEAKTVDESRKEKSEDKRSKKESRQGRKSHKQHKAQKGKGKAEYEKSEEVKPEEGKPEEGKPEETKGILKAKATAMEKGKGGELKSINGHPVIFVDDDEELGFNELLHLYALNARYDELKWIDIDSKFFDKFGKRVGAEKLKEKLAGI